MCEGDVVVGNVVEKVNFVSLQHGSSCDGVNRCVTPSLVEETSITVEGVEVVEVGWRSKPIQAADFKVRPLQDD